MANRLSNLFDRFVRVFITKGQPGSGDVHVDAPLQDEDFLIAKAAFDVGEMAPGIDNLEAGILSAAIGPAPGSASGETPVATSQGQPADGKLKPDGSRNSKDGDPASSGGKGGGAKAIDKDAEPIKGRRVASVAVLHGKHILMGKRRDNKKWTLPGGHVNPDEDMFTGAKRELREETGLADAEHMEELGPIQKVMDDLHVQPFVVKFAERPSTSMLRDPDGEVERWRWIDTTEGLPMEVKSAMHVPPERNCVLHALGIVKPPESDVKKTEAEAGEEDESGDNEESGLYDLAQVVAGTDYELEVGDAVDQDSAHETALANLQDDPNFYRKKWLEVNNGDEIGKDTSQEDGDDADSGVGLNLDLGSGQARQPGYLGLDLYPYDYGTIVHDLTLGLPFADGSAENIRLVNALHHIDGLSDDPKPLLSEIERVLMPDGEFTYEGPNELENDSQGMEEMEKEVAVDKANDGDSHWVKQKFRRVATPDAATANDAEPRIGISQMDELPADALLAMDALGYEWSDATTSGKGNRLHGYPSQGALVPKNGKVGVGKTKGLYLGARVPIMKMNAAKQIVYGVVLSPDEADLQDDMMTAEDIEKTAHGYLEKSRVVGSGHTQQIPAYPVESYIAPQDMGWTDSQYGPQKIAKGAWVLGVKVVDPKEWQKVVKGEYQGFSVGGFGLRDPLS